MHAWKWTDLCKTEGGGGLGIRRIEEANEAAGIWSFWRLCTSRNLCARWMTIKYLGDQSWEKSSVSILGSGSWKFLMASKEIALQYMHKDTNNDTWQWIGSNYGIFTFKSCWEIVRSKFQAWPYYSLVWFPSGKLLTKHFLKGLGIIQEDTFVFCMESSETIEHLFFQCPYSAYLWKLSKLKLDLKNARGTSLMEEANNIDIKFKQKNNTSTLAKLVFAAVVWHIWKERNDRIFLSESKHKILVFKNIYDDVQILMHQSKWKDNIQGNLNYILCNWGISAKGGLDNRSMIWGLFKYQQSMGAVFGYTPMVALECKSWGVSFSNQYLSTHQQQISVSVLVLVLTLAIYMLYYSSLYYITASVMYQIMLLQYLIASISKRNVYQFKILQFFNIHPVQDSTRMFWFLDSTKIFWFLVSHIPSINRRNVYQFWYLVSAQNSIISYIPGCFRTGVGCISWDWFLHKTVSYPIYQAVSELGVGCISWDWFLQKTVSYPIFSRCVSVLLLWFLHNTVSYPLHQAVFRIGVGCISRLAYQ